MEYNCNDRCSGCALAREERLDEYECCSCGAKWGPEGVPTCPVIRLGRACLLKEHHEGDHLFLTGRRTQCMFGAISDHRPRCEAECVRIHEHGKMCFCEEHLPSTLNDPCLASRSYNATLWSCRYQHRHPGKHKDRNGVEFTDSTAVWPIREILAANNRLRDAIDQIAAIPADHISKMPWESIKVLTYAINCSRNPGQVDGWIGEDDRPLPEDDEIKHTFPTRSGRHDLYDEARRLVSARFTKGGLIGVVNMLLHRIDNLKKGR